MNASLAWTSAWPAALALPVSCTYATEGPEGAEADSTTVISEEEILRFEREAEELLEMRCAVDFVMSAGSRITKAEWSRKRGRTDDKVAKMAGVLVCFGIPQSMLSSELYKG